jgi:hypothetical protein
LGGFASQATLIDDLKDNHTGLAKQSSSAGLNLVLCFATTTSYDYLLNQFLEVFKANGKQSKLPLGNRGVIKVGKDRLCIQCFKEDEPEMKIVSYQTELHFLN